MNKFKFKALSIGALLTSTFVLSPVVNAEENVSANQAVDAIDQEISQLQAASSVLNQEINSLNNEIIQNQQLVSMHQAEIEAIQQELGELEEEIKDLKEQLAKRKEKLADQARTLQKNGPLNYINYILESDSLSATISRINIVSDLISANKENLDQQQADEARLAEKQERVEEIKADQTAQLAELEGYNASLSAQVNERQVLVAEVANQTNHKLAQREQVIAEAQAAAIAQAQAEAAAAAQAEAQAQAEAEAAARAEAEAQAQAEAEAAAQAEAEAQAQAEAEAAAQAEAEAQAQAEAEAAAQAEAEAQAQAEAEAATQAEAEAQAQAEAEAAQAKAEAEAQAQAAKEAAAQAQAEAQAAKEAAEKAKAEQEKQAQAINVNVEPVKEEPKADQSSSKLHWPADARRITSHYGNRIHPIYGGTRFHHGVDIAGGGRILAAEAGTVTKTGPLGGYGNRIEIDHGGGFSTLYAHLAGYNVSPGQKVSRGQHIGTMGTTGASTGVHLHFETRVNGQSRNPMNYIK